MTHNTCVMAQQTILPAQSRSLIDALINTVGLGRVALSRGALPVVLVVRCKTDDDRILLRSDDQTLARAAESGDVVAFQVDDVRTDGGGCSVVVTGVLAPESPCLVCLFPTIITLTELHLGPPVKGTTVGTA